jgi:hypothetical protein
MYYIHVQCVKLGYMINIILTFMIRPMRIWVRIGPPHPLVCRKRQVNGVVLLMRLEKPDVPSQNLWALSIYIGLNFAALHWQWWHYSTYVNNSWAGRKTVNIWTNIYHDKISYIYGMHLATFDTLCDMIWLSITHIRPLWYTLWLIDWLYVPMWLSTIHTWPLWYRLQYDVINFCLFVCFIYSRLSNFSAIRRLIVIWCDYLWYIPDHFDALCNMV